jgi:deoxyadenosine/deoxycytidine kinase
MDRVLLYDAVRRYAGGARLFEARSTPVKRLVDGFKGRLIGLEGIICASKTTMGRAIVELARTHGVSGRFYPEEVNKELLQDYYASLSANRRPNPVAHALQMDTLSTTERAYETALRDLETSEGQAVGVLDRTRWGNCVFGALHRAYGNVSDVQFDEYTTALSKSSGQKLDYLVYLDTDPRVALDRVLNTRKSPEEQAIPLDYMYDLEAGYFLHLFEQLQLARNGTTNVVVVNTDAFCTAEEVLSVARGAPTRPFDVSPYSPEACLSDRRRVRGFFQRVGMYYRHAYT